jgi:sodium-dependent dicarboxylate transporter 2/3/5
MIFAWGTVINLFSIGVIKKQTGYQLGLLEWLLYGLVVAGVTYAIYWIVIRFVTRIDVSQMKDLLEPSFINEERKKLGPMSSGEKASIAVMCVAIVCWFTPEIVTMIAPGPEAKWLKSHLTWPATALVLAAACTIIPVKINGEKRMLLNWGEWTKSVEWGILSIIATGLVLGDVLSNNATGIPQFFMSSIGDLVRSGGGEYLLVFLVAGIGCLLTEGLSNFGLIAIFIPLAMSISTATGVGNPIAMAIVATGAYNQSFAMPLSPVLAIAYGTGWVNPKDAMKYGFLLDVLVGLGLTFIAYPILKMIVPMP